MMIHHSITYGSIIHRNWQNAALDNMACPPKKWIIPNTGFLARSCVSLKGSFPMVRRLPSGPREGRSHPLAGLV